MHRLGVVVFVLLCWASAAQAACSGSGTAWNCTAGTTPAQINSAISSASDGATLTFAAGSYTWGGGTIISPSASKAVTLICATALACDVTWSGIVLTLPSGGTTSKLYRISGFDFVSGSGNWWFQCPGGNCPETTIEQFRIDNNRWTLSGNQALLLSDNASIHNLHGVWDHNTVNINSMTVTPWQYIGATDLSPTNGRLASSSNMFFEDNTITATSSSGGVGVIDGWHGMGIVWRFNTVQNARVVLHGVPHSWGPANWEVYHNSFTNNSSADFPDCYRHVHHQGSGTYMVWENAFNCSGGYSGSMIVVLHYRAFQDGVPDYPCDGNGAVDGNRSPTTTYRGYPCYHQPGRDYNGAFKPMYVWRNRTAAGAKVDMEINSGGGVSPDWTDEHLVLNRDLYNAVSANAQTSATTPFNGTTGMGFGTLANRPTTCTPTPDSQDAGQGGVGYWATDGGTNWNTSNGSGNDGGLYTCSALNAWTLHYTPYTYPHPLTTVSGGGSTSLPAPTNLRVVQ